MTDAAAGLRFSRLLPRLVARICGCALPRWKVELSRTVAGVTVRAEARSS